MKALLIVDLQNDFMPRGALAVPEGDQVIPIINALIPQFELVVASQDWHPPDHISFASNHPGKKPGDIITVEGRPQILWPNHCVCTTHGAELVPSLNKQGISNIFYKGSDKSIDSYSAFFDNARQKSTGLGEFLLKHKVTDVYLVGVATEYCVLYSTLDAIDLGFSAHVIIDGCRAINLSPDDEKKACDAIVSKGGEITTSTRFSGIKGDVK